MDYSESFQNTRGALACTHCDNLNPGLVLAYNSLSRICHGTVVGRTGPLSVQRASVKAVHFHRCCLTFYNNLRYADNVALLATAERNLQQLVNDVGKASERFGLSLNAKKAQVMVIGDTHLASI